MGRRDMGGASWLVVAMASAGLLACGGGDTSDPFEAGDGGTGGSGTAGTSTGGGDTGGSDTGGSSTGGGDTGGSSTGGTGTAGTSTGGSDTGGTGNTEDCPAQASGVSANRMRVEISWPANTGLEAGSGIMQIWTLNHLDFDGTVVSGTAKSCGSLIPPFTKSAIAGGGQVQTLIPDEVWDTPGMPEFAALGEISGFNVGATITMTPVFSLVGLKMDNPKGAWPSDPNVIDTTDPDGNGKPGILAVPRTDGNFGAPPVSLFGALDPNGPRADQLGLVTRTAFALQGTRDACTSAKGNVVVHNIDSHVVHCRIRGGGDCTAAESGFIDSNQPKFSFGNSSYVMIQMPEDATCADVRAALPPL